jgi:CheY-like chemotaxis protein
MPPSPRIVLYVDDDADDREIVGITINEIDPLLIVVQAENGIEAIEYLFKAKDADVLPCLVILDVNMPKMDGRKTLAEIKKDEQLKGVPVVIFSTYYNPEDKPYYDQYGVEMVTKPYNLLSIQQEVKRLLQSCA